MVKNNNQGKWQSEINVDLPPFITYQIERNKPHRERYNKERKETAKKMAGEIDEKKKADAQARMLERTAIIDKAKAETQKRLMKKMLAQDRNAKLKAAAKKPAGMPSASQEQAFQATLAQHRETTYNILMQSAARGEQTVSMAVIASARNTTLYHLTNTNAFLKSTYGTYLSFEALKEKMTKAENEARQMYIEHHAKSSSKK